MAERRMFAKTIIDSDAFLDMPITTRLLYYDLGMRADDDGFVNSPKKIMRITGATQDDLGILIAKKFIIPFESGIVVIKHWKIHNYIRKDTYNETKYKDEKSCLALDENNAYTKISDTPLQDRGRAVDGCVDEPSTQVRLGKVRLGKVRLNNTGAEAQPTKPTKRFTPPTLEEVQEYCTQRHNGVDAQHFLDYYEARGWELSKGRKVKDWKACVRTWERSGFNKPNKQDAYNELMGRIRARETDEYSGSRQDSNNDDGFVYEF